MEAPNQCHWRDTGNRRRLGSGAVYATTNADITTGHGGKFPFTEVKTRRGRGQPWDALHEAKRAQVRRMARAYLTEATDRPRTRLVRFDAIGVVIDLRGRLTRLEHLENAF
ncbi:MAG: YraN family protein [Baekduia sp.]